MRSLAVAIATFAALLSTACSQSKPQITAADPESEGSLYVAVSTPDQSDALDQYWVGVAPVGSPDDSAKHVRHVGRGTSAARISHLEPGTYEVRLHGRWPKETHHVVDRRVVEVR